MGSVPRHGASGDVVPPDERRLLAGIVVLALALRVLLMLARADYVMYDEGYYLLLSRALLAGEGYRLSGLPHVALSPLQPTVVAAIAFLGVPVLVASRLLAVAAGALLVLPVAAIARRIGGPRVGLAAAAFVATAPALMSFVPFFPGRGWNLYFGSEPLFLLVAFGAVALAMRVAEMGGWLAWAGTGALAGAAYLTRGEGVVLAPLVLGLCTGRLLLRRSPAVAWRGPAVAVGVALVCSAPYLAYLHGMLGRWAFSGRVQAAAPAHAPRDERPAAAISRSGGAIVEDFIWRGDREALWNAAFRLDPSGTRMASQYWGVPTAPAPHAAAPPPAPSPSLAARDTSPPEPSPRAEPPATTSGSRAVLFWRGISTVAPAWMVCLAILGFVIALADPRRRAMLAWLTPLLAASLLPALVAYVEPRSLLPLVPLSAIGAALLLARVADELAPRLSAARRGMLLPTIVVTASVALVAPVVRDWVESLPGDRPLQQVSTARRAVSELLDAKLPRDAIVASWHPSVGYFADRDWRVLPYEPLDRVLGYAHAQGVSAIVLSRFEPTPLADPTHAFQVLLLDPAAPAPDLRAPRLATVEETPLVVVRRVLPAGSP